MNPIIGGALIQGVGSLLGGLLGSKKVSSRQASRGAIYGQAEGARLAAEKLGFNPLTLLGVSSAVGGYDSPNPMGAALADAAGALASGITAKAQRDDALAKAQQEIEDLRQKVNRATVRPVVQGVFGSPQARARTAATLELPPAMINVRQPNGRVSTVPNPDVASDFETTAMAEANRGNFFRWAGGLIADNMGIAQFAKDWANVVSGKLIVDQPEWQPEIYAPHLSNRYRTGGR